MSIKSFIINLFKTVSKMLTKNSTPKRLNKKNAIYTPASNQIALINYSPKKKILEVEFKKNNSVYHYLKVTPEIWKQFESEVRFGGSAGKFFNVWIKSLYEAVRVSN